LRRGSRAPRRRAAASQRASQKPSRPASSVAVSELSQTPSHDRSALIHRASCRTQSASLRSRLPGKANAFSRLFASLTRPRRRQSGASICRSGPVSSACSGYICVVPDAAATSSSTSSSRSTWKLRRRLTSFSPNGSCGGRDKTFGFREFQTKRPASSPASW